MNSSARRSKRRGDRLPKSNRSKAALFHGFAFGRELLSTEAYERLKTGHAQFVRSQSKLRDYDFLRALPHETASEVLRLLPQSKGQMRQDLFVLSELDFKKNGFFVEFGATDGVGLSNTWLLEKHFGWTGILAEPANIWHGRLRQNRACAVDYRCVWDTTGEKVQFSEVPGEPGYSTIRSFLNMDMHAEQREIQNTYDVETVSLAELLSQHQAPREIDYLSVDTEGSELEILAAFDFDSYMIRVITVEHNFTANRERLRQLLEARGYERKFEKLSHVDDWYVRRSLIHD